MQEVLITGDLGKDAEVIQRKDGQEALTFSVAVSNGKDKQPTWYGCFLNGNTQFVAPYLVKGARVLVRGQLRAGAWTNRQGETVVSLDISTNAYGVEILKFADDNNVGSKNPQDNRPF